MTRFLKIMCIVLTVFILISVFIGCKMDNTDGTADTPKSDAENNNDNNNNDNNADDGASNEEPKYDGSWNADMSMTKVEDVAIDAPRVLLITDFHYQSEAQGVYLGVDKDVRMKSMVDNINAEHAKDPLEAIIFVGDYSLDHWQHGVKGTWLTKNTSYTKMFMDKYRASLPVGVPTYFTAGNHEQFSNEQWKTITGNERNLHFVVGDYLFIIWDSYGGNLDPKNHSDGTYTSINDTWARSVMDQYPDKKVMLVSHTVKTSDSITGEVVRDKRVVAMFVGHDHTAKIASAFGKPVLHCGNYSRCGDKTLSDTKAYMWGFRDLYLFKDSILSRYIVPDNTVYPENIKYTATYHYQNVFQLKVS